jgi:hypothetical protein
LANFWQIFGNSQNSSSPNAILDYRYLNDDCGLTSAPNDIKIRHTTLLVFKEHILINKIVFTVHNMARRPESIEDCAIFDYSQFRTKKTKSQKAQEPKGPRVKRPKSQTTQEPRGPRAKRL